MSARINLIGALIAVACALFLGLPYVRASNDSLSLEMITGFQSGKARGATAICPSVFSFRWRQWWTRVGSFLGTFGDKDPIFRQPSGSYYEHGLPASGPGK